MDGGGGGDRRPRRHLRIGCREVKSWRPGKKRLGAKFLIKEFENFSPCAGPTPRPGGALRRWHFLYLSTRASCLYAQELSRKVGVSKIRRRRICTDGRVSAPRCTSWPYMPNQGKLYSTSSSRGRVSWCRTFERKVEFVMQSGIPAASQAEMSTEPPITAPFPTHGLKAPVTGVCVRKSQNLEVQAIS